VSNTFINPGDSFTISVTGSCPSNLPGNCLIECRINKDGSYAIDFDHWDTDKDGDAELHFTCEEAGNYFVQYCVVGTDFYVNGGWGSLLNLPDITVTCCDCDGWSNGKCGAEGGCSEGYRKQTRTCTPSGCYDEERCVFDSTCPQP